MPRPSGVTYDSRAKCWTTNSLGEVRTTAGGRRYRAKTYWRDLAHPTKDRRAAEARLADALRAEEARLRPADDPTLDQLQEWYLEAAERDLSAETFARRVELLDRALDWPDPGHPQRLGRLRARSASADDVRPFLDALLAEGRSEAYVVDGLLMALKRMLAWASEVPAGRYGGLPLPANPLARLKGYSVPRRARRESDPAAVTRFLKWAWRRAHRHPGLNGRFARIAVVLLLTLRATGARPKELCVAWWEEWEARPDGWGVITLPWWKHKTGRKTKKERVIAVPPNVARRIEWIRGLDGRHADHIFTHRRGPNAAEKAGSAEAGAPWTEVDPKARRIGDSKVLRKWFARCVADARAAGVKLPDGFRLYWFRSGFSTEAQRRGVPRAMLAEAMGTSEAMLDVHYSDFDREDIVATAKRAAGPSRP